MAVPYSRYLFGALPWYSFLIVLGAALAIWLAVREEKRTDFPKDTVLDFALWALPCGIIGARLYYVIFSWSEFRGDLLSILRVWEGGIAIYGAVIAGLLTAWIFCRCRKISFLQLCDLVAPGLILAQAIGRWGNYFNQEAYGRLITDPALCFFPFAVLIQTSSGAEWHMATFFYESLWNFLVFLFLIIARRKLFRYRGDVFCFYAFLYACGRLVIEDFRMDSLYAASSVRVSQLLSLLICLGVFVRYFILFRSEGSLRFSGKLLPAVLAVLYDLGMLPLMLGWISVSSLSLRFILLLSCSLLNILGFVLLYVACAKGEVIYADIKE